MTLPKKNRWINKHFKLKHMKRLFLVLAVAGALTACSNSSNTAAAKKDSLDSTASEKKEMVDSTTSAVKDKMDSTADVKKNKIDSATKAKKEKIDSTKK